MSKFSRRRESQGLVYDLEDRVVQATDANGVTGTNAYDALNRVTNMVDAVGTTRYGYWRQHLQSEDGPWASDTVSYTNNSAGLRQGLSLQQPGASAWDQTSGYDADERLKTLTSPAGAFTYSYSGAGGLWTNLALPNSGRIANQYDLLARLTNTALLTSGQTILNDLSSHVTLSGVATPFGSVSAPTDCSYYSPNHDTNQTYGPVGLRYHVASATPLVTGVTVDPQWYRNDFTGWVGFQFTVASTPMTVSELGRWVVSSNSASHLVKLVRSDWTDQPGGSTTVATAGKPAGAFAYSSLPAPVTLAANTTYYLVSHEVAGGDAWYNHPGCTITLAGVATLFGPAWSLDSPTQYYSAQYNQSYVPVSLKYAPGAAWVLAQETRYVYDGMLVVQERDGNNTPTVTYTRGHDLSGTREGAGGIGGLLARTANSQLPSASAHALYHADGNGNITALMDSSQAVAAQYVYDPFGRLMTSTGPLASANLYRFSSKQHHPFSGLYYYGYRFCDPELQRWLNRDPLGEEGGINLHGFVGNAPLSRIDLLGLRFHWKRLSACLMDLGINEGIGFIPFVGPFIPEVQYVQTIAYGDDPDPDPDAVGAILYAGEKSTCGKLSRKGKMVRPKKLVKWHKFLGPVGWGWDIVDNSIGAHKCWKKAHVP